MFWDIRPGNRGGKDLFKWEDLKVMNYKDREQYIGFTSKVGFLDKGGKWRRRDWYMHKDGDITKADKNAEINIDIVFLF